MNAGGNRLCVCALVSAVALLGMQVAAYASLGTGVGASPITLDHPVHPGNSYRLPSLYVVNTGTEPSDYAVHVARLSEGPQRDVPSSWVSIVKPHFHLEPKQATMVPLTLAVPQAAESGDYLTNLVAGTVPPGASGGVALGAAAAGKLTFSVTPSPGIGIPWPWPAGVYLAIALTLLGAGGAALLRRTRLQIQIQRKR